MFSIDPEAELQRLQLNYGYIEVGTMQGRYNISYSAPGVTKNGQNLLPSAIEDMRLAILATGTSNMNYIQQFIDYFDAGMCVGQCTESKYFVQDTCDIVQSGCESFQGGFIKYWTKTELLNEQGPYVREVDDAIAIQSYTNYVPPDPTSYTVQIMAPIGNGSMTPTPKIYTFSSTECFTIDAVAGLGWAFSHWIVNGQFYYHTNESFCYRADGYVIQAVFVKPTNGSGEGPVSYVPLAIALGGATVAGIVYILTKK